MTRASAPTQATHSEPYRQEAEPGTAPDSTHAAPRDDADPARAPLAGVRVLDLTSAVVGPYAAKIMGDYGAEVIKVEGGDGDMIRWIAGPSPTPGMSGKFVHLNRNKRSIAIDLKKPEGREVVMRLIADTDVVLINMRPQAVARLGLDYASVAARNPRVVYCAMTGFGPGPYRDKPAYDSIIQGGCGLAALNDMAAGEPRYVPYVVADRTVGLMALNAVMMALFQRERTGLGQSVEVPMFENMAALILAEHMYGATYDPPLSPPGDLRLIDPRAQPVKTLDGYVCLTSNTDAQAYALMDALGLPEMKHDPRFSTKAARAAHSADFFRIRAEAMAQRTSEEWLRRLDEADVPCMRYNTLDTLADDPHIVASGLLKKVVHPTEGAMWDLRDGTRLSGYAPDEPTPAPRMGQHGEAILQEAGYAPDDIAALYDRGAVRRP